MALLEPVTAAVIGVTLPHERLTVAALSGAAVLLLAVVCYPCWAIGYVDHVTSERSGTGDPKRTLAPLWHKAVEQLLEGTERHA